jgi:hypothetical protein
MSNWKIMGMFPKSHLISPSSTVIKCLQKIIFNTSPKIKNEFTDHCFYLNGVKNGAVGINEKCNNIDKEFYFSQPSQWGIPGWYLFWSLLIIGV